MFCPRCKTEIPKNALRCPHCGVKVRSKCPTCGTLNIVTALNCLHCGHELLKKCSSCGAFNLPSSRLCRKCQSSLEAVSNISIVEEMTRPEPPAPEATIESIQQAPHVPSQKKETLEMEEKGEPEKPFSEQEVSAELKNDEKEQLEVKNLIVNSLMNSSSVLCSLTAGEGLGKSYVLDFVGQDLINAKIVFMKITANPITQLSPFGLFQDLFLQASGMPNYYVESQQKETDVIKLIEQSFGLTSDDACVLFNFLYPVKTAYYEEILHNKEQTKALISKIFSALKTKGEVVLAIDNFDLIDGSSIEMLSDLYRDGILDENFKLFVITQNLKNVDGFLQITGMPAEKCEKFFMGSFNEENAIELTKNILNGFDIIPKPLMTKIIKESHGSPLYIGQIMLLMNESGFFNFDGTNLTCLVDDTTFTPPTDISAVLTKRLERIRTESPALFKALIVATMLGLKFNMIMLQAVLGLDQAGLQELVQSLVSLAMIKPVENGEWLEFASYSLWKHLFEIVKKEDIYAQCSIELLAILEKLRLTNTAYKPLLAQNAKNSERAFSEWSEVMKTSTYIGDVNLYVLAQKQCLKLNSELELLVKLTVDTNIRMRLGRLLCETEPELALDFLSAILSIDLEQNNTVNFIDIASHAVIAANNVGNYNAVVDIVDNVVNLLTPPEKYKLEIALINTRKIKTLLYLGSFEQLANIIENEINPQLEDALSQNYTVYNLPISKIFETWLETNFVFAETLILQGNNKVYDVIAALDEALSAHVEELQEYKLKLNYIKAFALAMKGSVVDAEQLIDDIAITQKDHPLEPELICRLNLLQVLIRFMKHDFSNMKTYLYEAVTYANNAGDYMGKNLLKSALGKLLENEGDFTKSYEIYNDQITYFAKERIAIGALLTWYLIADLYLKLSDPEKALQIAQNALDVAKNPRINSFYFQVVYKRLIAEIYMLKGDLEATKMYLEKSLLITKKFNLEYLNLQLYDVYAKYHIEMFKTGNDGGSSPLVSAKKLYEKAINLASKLGLLNIVDELKQEYQALLTFAQLKKVSLV